MPAACPPAKRAAGQAGCAASSWAHEGALCPAPRCRRPRGKGLFVCGAKAASALRTHTFLGSLLRRGSGVAWTSAARVPARRARVLPSFASPWSAGVKCTTRARHSTSPRTDLWTREAGPLGARSAAPEPWRARDSGLGMWPLPRSPLSLRLCCRAEREGDGNRGQMRGKGAARASRSTLSVRPPLAGPARAAPRAGARPTPLGEQGAGLRWPRAQIPRTALARFYQSAAPRWRSPEGPEGGPANTGCPAEMSRGAPRASRPGWEVAGSTPRGAPRRRACARGCQHACDDAARGAWRPGLREACRASPVSPALGAEEHSAGVRLVRGGVAQRAYESQGVAGQAPCPDTSSPWGRNG